MATVLGVSSQKMQIGSRSSSARLSSTRKWVASVEAKTRLLTHAGAPRERAGLLLRGR